jgi:hypothetical protein
MEVGESLVINSSSLLPLRIAQWGVVLKCSRKLSTVWKQHMVSWAVLEYIYRVRKKNCYKPSIESWVFLSDELDESLQSLSIFFLKKVSI